MKKNIKNKFGRKYNTRSEYKIIYIFTEGKETEPNYFESKKKEIRKTNIQIVVKGVGYNTLSLVDYALDYISKEQIEINGSAESDKCWVVFDKDDYDRDFDNAIRKAENNNLKVAYSNECFELWFLLHFDFINTAIGRKNYINKLDKKMNDIDGQNYQKNSENMYDLIKHLEKDAIRNAGKLLKMYKKSSTYSKKNPSTTVHLLVEDLNELRK